VVDRTYDTWNSENRLLRKCDLVGISSMTPSYQRALRLARSVGSNGGPSVIVGGPHISLVPMSLGEDAAAGVIGEGELTFVDVCEAYARAGRNRTPQLEAVAGLVYWREGKRIGASSVPERSSGAHPTFTRPNG
jgi:radical SAM superfamily enzyme YgiQ (UPF0313 family)